MTTSAVIKSATSKSEIYDAVEALLDSYGIREDHQCFTYAESAGVLQSALDDIESGSFAEAAYNSNSIEELTGIDPDEADMRVWGIDEDEWKDAVTLARNAKIGDEIISILELAEERWHEVD